MKIAYFSPLPPQRTGIADYSKELLEELVKRAEIDLWVDGPVDEDNLPDCAIYRYANVPKLRRELRKYDSIIYHMGNSQAHQNIYRMLLDTSGIVVMHDFGLHHFFAGYYLEALRSPAAYIEEMSYNYGPAGRELARRALRGERQIWEQEPLRYPLNLRVLDHARGVIVHSDFTRRLVHQSHPHLPLAKINLPVAIAGSQNESKELKRRYGIPADRVVIGSLGFGSSAKQIEMAVRTVRALGRNDVVYLLVGEVGESLRGESHSAGLDDIVRATGYVDWKTYNDYCHLIDIGIDIRYPTVGESSASVCRILGAGKPCVVSDVGWFAEIPNDCAVKVDPVLDERTLGALLSDLIANEGLRRGIGENGRRHISQYHSPERAAVEYLEFVDEVSSLERKRNLERTIVDDIGATMAEIGVVDRDGWLVNGIAEQIASLFRSGE